MKINISLLLLILLGSARTAYAFELLEADWVAPGIYFHTDIDNVAGEPNAPSGESWTSAFERAMQEWTDATNFSFIPVSENAIDPCLIDNRNAVDFTNDYCGINFGSSTLAVTTSLYMITGDLIETDIVFNDTKSWDIYTGLSQFPVYDFYRVAGHELGHALGLGHEDDVASIMATNFGGTDSLQSDDINGANTLYTEVSAVSTIQNPFFPLFPNSNWSYAEENGGLGFANNVLEGTFTIPSYTIYNYETKENEEIEAVAGTRAIVDSDNKVEYFSVLDTGVELIQSVSKGNTVNLLSGVKIISAAPFVGEQLDSEGIAAYNFGTGKINGSYTATSLVEAAETLATPLGTLNAIRILLRINISGGFFAAPYSEIRESKIWLVEHLGMVKVEYYSLVDGRTSMSEPTTTTEVTKNYEITNALVDGDQDQVNDLDDNCLIVANNAQIDTDDDNYGDACDLFPNDDTEITDNDSDGTGDNADRDDDNDRLPDDYELASSLDPLGGDSNTDSDSDGYTDYQEFVAGTDAGDAQSNLLTEGSLFARSLVDVTEDGIVDVISQQINMSNGNNLGQVWNTFSEALVYEHLRGPNYLPRFLQVVPDIDNSGIPELALLKIAPNNGTPVVEVRDATSGTVLGNVNFSSAYAPIELLVTDINNNNIPELALLNHSESLNKIKVDIKDIEMGTLINRIGFGHSYLPIDMVEVPDLNNNNHAEIAVLLIHPVNGKVRVQIRDSDTDALINNINFGAVYTPIGLEVLADMDGGGYPELVVLERRTSPDKLRAHIRDAMTDALVNKVNFKKTYLPIDFGQLPDISGDGIAELVMLGERIDDQLALVQILNPNTGDLINQINYGNSYLAQGLMLFEDIDGFGRSAVGVPGIKTSDGKMRILIKDAMTDETMANISLP